MGFDRKFVTAGLAVLVLLATSGPAQNARAADTVRRAQLQQKHPQTLTRDDGMEVVAVALDRRTRIGRVRDCSHLVHAVYDRAGFAYPYASSSDLYRGTDDFRRVKKPQPGDLIVWKGHVGIVVNPKGREFYSFLRHGPGIDEYDAHYWKQRGPVRFYRYIKADQQALMESRDSR